MKKTKNFILLIIVLLTLTGCIKHDTTITINKDKSMKYQATIGFDKSLSDMSDTNDEENADINTEIIDEETKKELEKNGFKIKDYEDNQYKGIEVELTVENIDTISSEKEIKYNLGNINESKGQNEKMFYVKKGFFYNTYTANFIFDMGDTTDTNEETNVEESNDELDNSSDVEINDDTNNETSNDTNNDLAALEKTMSLNLNVNLPYKAIKHNATSSSNNDKKLTWDYTKMKEDTNFSFRIYNTTNICITAGIGLVIISGLVIVIIKAKKSKKEKYI